MSTIQKTWPKRAESLFRQHFEGWDWELKRCWGGLTSLFGAEGAGRTGPLGALRERGGHNSRRKSWHAIHPPANDCWREQGQSRQRSQGEQCPAPRRLPQPCAQLLAGLRVSSKAGAASQPAPPGFSGEGVGGPKLLGRPRPCPSQTTPPSAHTPCSLPTALPYSPLYLRCCRMGIMVSRGMLWARKSCQAQYCSKVSQSRLWTARGGEETLSLSLSFCFSHTRTHTCPRSNPLTPSTPSGDGDSDPKIIDAFPFHTKYISKAFT